MPADDDVLRDRTLYSSVASCSSGVELDRAQVVVVGNGGVNTYTLARAPDGALTVSLLARRRSGLGLQTATRLPSGALWAGTTDGFIVALPPGARGGPVLARETVRFSVK